MSYSITINIFYTKNTTNKCKSLLIKDNKIINCESNINENENFCDKHIFINRFFNEIKECCICYEIIDKTIEIPVECGHIFHKNCLTELKNKNCPLCKKEFTNIEKLFFQKSDTILSENERISVCRRFPRATFMIVFFLICFLIILSYSIVFE